jgi:hypothetical protein
MRNSFSWLWVLSLSLLASAGLAAGCDLTVHVEGKDGRPFPHTVRVEIARNDGTRLAGEAENGLAQFCDVGLNTFDIQVGGQECAATVVRNVWVDPPATTDVRVVYQFCKGFVLPT